MPSPTAIWTPPGAVQLEPLRPGKETVDTWGGNPWTVRGGDWHTWNANLYSINAVNGAIPVNAPGAYLDTRGPSGVGYARILTSIFASGVSKLFTISLRRDGVQIGSNLYNSSFADDTTGARQDTIFVIPAYPYAAHYELWWQANTSGAGRTQHSSFRQIYVPSYRNRLESTPDRTIVAKGNVGQSFPILVHPDLVILRADSGPHRRGSARMVWSINANGVGKTGTRIRLIRSASPWLPAATLYDFTPGVGVLVDSLTGLNYDSGVITLPPMPHPVAYRWTIDTNAGCVYQNTNSANGGSGTVNNRRIHVSQGYISVPPVRGN